MLLFFVFLIIGVIVWIFVLNWYRVELTINIFGIGSDALSRNLGLFGVVLCFQIRLLLYYVPIVVFLMFARLNGKIVPCEESNGEYLCFWKQDRWVPAYYAMVILTMLWSSTVMVEAKRYVISGTIAQWYFSKDDSTPKRKIRSCLRNYGVPLHLVRELYKTFSNFKIRIADYIRYRMITSNMNDRFPDASPEELNTSDATCIIC